LTPGAARSLIAVFAVALVILGSRLWLWHLVPTYFWSDDGGSYARPALRWLDTGVWKTDPKRGPIYSMFLAGCLKATGHFNAVAVTQHFLAGLSVLFGVLLLRQIRSTAVPLALFLCGWAYAVYGNPLYLAQLIRNETLLYTFATVTFVGLWYGLHTGSIPWLAAAGIAAGFFELTKSKLFLPMVPLIAVALCLGHSRGSVRRWLAPTTFGAAFCAILLAGTLSKRLLQPDADAPQAGLLLFGRTAQWTVLESPLHAEMKSLIRDDIVAYQTRLRSGGQPDNNWILNRGPIPKMREALKAQGRDAVALESLCNDLAMEAIKANPWAYIGQVLHDIKELLFKFGDRIHQPGRNEVIGALNDLREATTRHPTQHFAETVQILEARTGERAMKGWERLVRTAWLFQVMPVFFAALAGCWFAATSRGPERWWWILCMSFLFLTLAINSTVGRPMNRYLIPITPILFWSLSAGFLQLWDTAAAWRQGRAALR
jgi:hypothetical protein